MPANYYLDRFPVSILDNFHEFRENKFPFTYLCKNCIRAFDSEKIIETCKFCGSESIIETHARLGKNFRHYCPTCDKSFTTTDKFPISDKFWTLVSPFQTKLITAEFCRNCKLDYLHIYKWQSLTVKERLLINLRKTVNEISKVPRANISLPRQRRPKEEMPTF